MKQDAKGINIWVSEYSGMYKNAKGEVSPPHFMTWEIRFSSYFKKFIGNNFHKGYYVTCKGIMNTKFHKLEEKEEEKKYRSNYIMIGQAIALAPNAFRNSVWKIKRGLGDPNEVGANPNDVKREVESQTMFEAPVTMEDIPTGGRNIEDDFDLE
jgi:hypothetical protein